MRPIVDIIGDVVTACKQAQTVTLSGTASPYSVIVERSDLLFTGMQIKLMSSEFTASGLYVIASIVGNMITVTGTEIIFTNVQESYEATITPVVNYLYGEREEMGRTLVEWSKTPVLNKEQFPLICLVQPFKESVINKGYDVEVSLNILILTDSKQGYLAEDRYTYSFKPILYPLLDLFISRLRNSKEISPEISEYDKTDHVEWGKLDVTGKPVSLFSDFVDGIEIENLKIKIFKTQ
jgi:hypothetical protein